jgi:poly(3-hydroxybutyrate) depolymerase
VCRRNRPEIMMKWILLSLVMVSGLAGCAVPQDQNVPNREALLTEPHTGRTYFLYVSSKYNRLRPAPMIISLQGTAPYDTATGQVKEWKKLAEDQGAILVCPTLKSSDGILTGPDDGLLAQLLEDERFVMSILSELQYRYNVDRRNVFLTCWSGGGYPLYFIGLRHPDVFTAMCARQSTFRQGALEGWFPDAARRMPVRIFYGTTDFVPIQNECKQAYSFLQAQGFHQLELTTSRGGHERHPELAMEFFLQHWNIGMSAREPVSALLDHVP